jgi:hypothetical protein
MYKLKNLIFKNSLMLFAALIISGCAVIDGEYKVVNASSPTFITLQVVQPRSEWAKSLAQSHCARSSKIPYDFTYYDNSWHKEATYFCIDEKERNELDNIYRKLDYEQFALYLRSTYGGIPSQIQRVGTVAAPLSNLIVKPITSAPTMQPIQMFCIKSGETITGMFKTCRYSCGGTPVSNTVRLSEVCEMQRKF